MTTGYLGPIGTFSHCVALRRFGRNADLAACPSIGAIFEFLGSEPGRRAVVPIENSSGGTIYDTVDLLVENAGRLFIQEEISLEVRIALLGKLGRPVRRVFSHFVQVQNHRNWLGSHYPDAEVISVSSTAVAAAQAAADPEGAALSAFAAAEIYGLDVLSVPKLGGVPNVTQFVVLGCQPKPVKNPEQARTAVAVTFTNQSGSLYRFLAPFAKEKVNINRIISRPFQRDASRSLFFMQIDGADGVTAFEAAMAKARRRSDLFLDFGSYPWNRRVRS